ncbi:alcohol dehydrogenase protein [Coniophora puteana RWD-64-598 SS2]|uniref:Alcohol dehydrogenase protein n=1 Tax=Coniophora puteana (strain RWD-64-598) TaxID=741705 RepID=A0A5M3MC23_CONPW|nr:alcohol dehydrogenase protein [Coniophora puteana RWD-64-598 SS2]EIW76597.1 alcohol dehydrogenase protein [Coniophora puteana RWD-64-598 SS2]
MALPETIREFRTSHDGYRHLKLRDAPLEKPSANEVLIKIHSVSLNYKDLIVTNSTYKGWKDDVVPVSDAAGEIVLLGAGVVGWTVGERVCAQIAVVEHNGDITPESTASALGAGVDGVLREYACVPVHALVRFPENLSYDEASTLPCAALTAYNALFGLKALKKGDSVLLLGTGGVSIFGLQLAVAAGATAIITSSSDEKLELAKRLGAKHTINYNKTESWDEEVLKITNGRGVDHVVEVGGTGTIAKSANAVRYSGCLDLIGFVAKGEHQIPSSLGGHQIPLGVAILKALVIRGIMLGSVTQFEAMNRFIAEHDIHPVVDKVFTFEEAVDAFAYLESQKHVGKLVIRLARD